MTRVLAPAVAVLAALAVTAGCSSARPAPGRSGGSTLAAPSASAPSSAVAPSSTAGTTPVPSATATASSVPSTAPPPTSSPAPTASPSSTTAAPRSTCRRLSIRVIRGSAAPGYEFAALQFTNTGTARCVLNGYPTVSLLRGATPVGRPSTPDGAAASRYALAPGATAESRLRDFSSCQAPLSDQVHVLAPGSTISATRPAQLRACTMRVAALTAPE